MKASEIQVGKCYTNGKGAIRHVYDFPVLKRWEGPYLLYTHETGKKHGKQGACSISAFAAWAKAEVPGGSDG